MNLKTYCVLVRHRIRIGGGVCVSGENFVMPHGDLAFGAQPQSPLIQFGPE